MPATCTVEVLRIAAATFADRVAFTETLQQHKEELLFTPATHDRLLQGTARQ